MFERLDSKNLPFAVFDEITPDSPAIQGQRGAQLYFEQGCDGIIAVGGGSVIDGAKLIGALCADTHKNPADLMGALTIRGTFPPFIAVPTTAGTGSETTAAAVISFPEEHKKKALVDPKVIPVAAILDPEVTCTLPDTITAATGMDALTHSIESYLSTAGNATTDTYALRSTGAIFENLPVVFADGKDMAAREAMMVASFDAGVAFTRTSLGYVHAIAHQLGAQYHIPHGFACAMVLPYVLSFYLDDPTCQSKLADLAVAAGLGGNPDADAADHSQAGEVEALLSERLVQGVRDLNVRLSVPTTAKGLVERDFDVITKNAIDEAHGTQFCFFESPVSYMTSLPYPVPKYMSEADVKAILIKLTENAMAQTDSRSNP
jgi:alcohol dehydrogenase class IV